MTVYVNHYAERDPVALGQHFANHMDAMTREGLDGKFEIAEELAWRDWRIERLTDSLERMIACVERADVRAGWCCCGDSMENHGNPMDCGHSPVDMGEYYTSSALELAKTVLEER